MATFNEVLRVNSVEPTEVALLRHTGQKGPRGYSPYDLLLKRNGEFDIYQCVQKSGQRIFLTSKFWASFVGTPDGSTLFVGLYKVAFGDQSRAPQLCPMTGKKPGQDSRHDYDYFELELVDALAEHRESLEIEWGKGYVAWVQRAQGNHKKVLGALPSEPFERFAEASEGRELWVKQRLFERSDRLPREAFALNFARNGGVYHCQSCDYSSINASLFDAHHPNPLANGERVSRAIELLVLCPTCHRKAHVDGRRLSPYSLSELREWVAAGRP